MIRKASQTAINPISRSGIAQPASMPSSQLRNGLRQRAGEISERAAIPANAKSMGTKTHIIQQVNRSDPLVALRAKVKTHRTLLANLCKILMSILRLDVGLTEQMPAMGQALPKWDVRARSVFPLIATEDRPSQDVSNVPTAVIAGIPSWNRRSQRRAPPMLRER